MIASLALAAALAVAAPSPAMQDSRPDCAITVHFVSYAAGIDRAAEARIKAYLESRPDLQSEVVGRRGREGEYTLCIRTASDDQIQQTYQALRALAPKGGRGGPVDIRLAGARRD